MQHWPRVSEDILMKVWEEEVYRENSGESEKGSGGGLHLWTRGLVTVRQL